MIDTIVLTVPVPSGGLFISNGADIPGWELHSKSVAYEKWVKNQTKKQKMDGIYRPRIRFVKRGATRLLQIEFSIPKLLFGNNVDEVCAADFEEVLRVLKERLKDFGVIIQSDILRQAVVPNFHPSKNITISGGYTAMGIIKELQKVNLTTKMDLTRFKFANNGESAQYYAGSNSFVIYDKLSDLNKPKKRAVDKDQTPQQLNLFSDTERQLLEILRLEVRLVQKRRMNSILAECGFEPNLTFEEVFKKEVCMKIVKRYWEKCVAADNLFLFTMVGGPQNTLRQIRKKEPGIKQKQAIYLAGLSMLARDEQGVRGLRSVLKVSNREWYRIASDFSRLDFGEAHSYSWVAEVSKQLNEFAPVKLSTLNVKESKV